MLVLLNRIFLTIFFISLVIPFSVFSEEKTNLFKD